MKVWIIWYQDEWDYDYHTHMHSIYADKRLAEQALTHLVNTTSEKYYSLTDSEVIKED